MSDKLFKQTYGDNLCSALFTFPKFKRNYSKNYKKVQTSFAKFSKSKIKWINISLIEKKTIVFDIDETLVYASDNYKDIP